MALYLICQYMKYFKLVSERFSNVALNIQHKNETVRQPITVKCNRFVLVLFTGCGLIYLQNLLLMMKKPERPHFLTSLLSLENQHNWPLKLPLVIIQNWVWYNCYTQILFYVFTIHVYACAGIELMNELKYVTSL